MSNAWKIASHNFNEDDGSLPTVEFDQLSPESVSKLYRFIFEAGHCVTENPTIWDYEKQNEVSLLSVENPCDWVQERRADAFHCCFGGITVNSVEIPVLGDFVFRDAIQIDFRMGANWNPTNLDAFFRFIASLKSIAPEAIIRSAESEGLMDENAFLKALQPYLEQDGFAE